MLTNSKKPWRVSSIHWAGIAMLAALAESCAREMTTSPSVFDSNGPLFDKLVGERTHQRRNFEV
jgi:hypothetical protein